MNKLMDTTTRQLLRAHVMKELYWPRKAPAIVEAHDALYDFAATRIGPDTPILYLEFGVAGGRSIIAMTQRFHNPASVFVGFDSFAGLPEAWLHLPKGAFSTMGKLPRIADPRARFVKGWFQNTIHPFLESLNGSEPKTVLMHFDADLYGSTLFLLSSLWPHFPAYYFLMDDFMHDDSVALFDFWSAYPTDITFHAQTRGGGPGPNPNQIFGHMRRVPFSLDDEGQEQSA